nr:RNA-directed DNA polymerase, eukaryota, reverse transcriptase zinc-binding domain protein [Tanacetum cinerariifolium]
MCEILDQYKRNTSHYCEKDLHVPERYSHSWPWYPKCSGFDLKGYSDSDYAGYNMDMKVPKTCECDDKVESQLEGSMNKVECGREDGIENVCSEMDCDSVKASTSCDNVSSLISDNQCENTEEMSNMNKSFKDVQDKKCNGNESKVEYAKIVNNLNKMYSNKLEFVMHDLDEEGVTIVKFEDDLVKEGCRKWVNTVYGYFLGTKMAIAEVKPRIEEEIQLKNKVKADVVNNEGFVKVNRRRNNANGKGGSKKDAEIRYKPVQKPIQKPVQEIVVDPEKENEKVQGEKAQDRNKNRMTPNSKGKLYNEDKKKNGTGSSKGWSLSLENKEALKLSANKYVVLQDEEDTEYENVFPVLISPYKKLNEQLKVCSTLEIHVKELNVSKICDEIFRRWEWASNAKYSPSGVQNYNWLGSKLCEGYGDSQLKSIHVMSNRGYLNKTGFHLSWTKSLKNPNTAIMKKLDRIMGNGDFISNFPQVQASFLPFMVFDHSPAVMIIPKSLKKKNRAFRFSNYISNKEEFIPTVKKRWDMRIEGFKMETKSITNSQELFTQKVVSNEEVDLCKGVTMQEIEEALKSIDDNKASVYKIISKILTNMMKNVLCRIVSKNQSAFIPRRSITDNILLTQELLKGYGCKQRKQRCAFKIDIMKAYDTKIVPFAVGKLPVRYLGVPLVTRRLTVKDCKSFVEKLCRHTRLLFSSFPRPLLKKLITSLKVSYEAKVKRLMVKQRLPERKLKGRNVWEVPSDDNASWGWRNLMELRDAGFHNNATVESMFGDGQSKIPDDWIAQNSLLKQVKPTLNKNSTDKVRWQSNDKNMVKFNIHRVWKDLKDQYDSGLYAVKIWEEARRKCQMQSGSNDWKNFLRYEERLEGGLGYY